MPRSRTKKGGVQNILFKGLTTGPKWSRIILLTNRKVYYE
jgi:hypothetical protein